jgi:hypothetical protein
MIFSSWICDSVVFTYASRVPDGLHREKLLFINQLALLSRRVGVFALDETEVRVHRLCTARSGATEKYQQIQ